MGFGGGFHFVGQVGVDIDLGASLHFADGTHRLCHGEWVGIVRVDEPYGLRYAIAVHKQRLEEIVGHRDAVGSDMAVKCVGEDGAAHHMYGIVPADKLPDQILYLMPHPIVASSSSADIPHHVVLRTDVGEIVALFHRLLRPFHVLTTSHVTAYPA